MDYTAEATVSNTTTYYVEAWDPELNTWIRVTPDEAHTEDGGWTDYLNAASYGADVKAEGNPVRIVEEIVMRAWRVYPGK